MTPRQLTNAIHQHFAFSKPLAYFLAKVSTLWTGKNGKLSFDDLHAHNKIEHDVSLSRQDAALGNHYVMDHSLIDQFLSYTNQQGNHDYDTVVKFRAARYLQSKRENPDFVFGLKARLLSIGESSMFLLAFGGATEQVSKSLTESVFAMEKFPEGWLPSAQPITFWSVYKLWGKIQKRMDELEKEQKQEM